jgi:hypothetical protein
MNYTFPIFIKNSIALTFIFLLSAFFVSAQNPTTTTTKAVEAVQPSPDATPTTSQPQTEPQTALGGPNVEPTNAVPRYVKREAPVQIPRFDAPPIIDGKLDDTVWKNAALFGDFLQTSPGENVKPTHPTEFMMGYDAKHLYMAFRIIQDRNTVRATLSRRDNIFNDDYVLVHLDTFNDQRQAYLLFFSPFRNSSRRHFHRRSRRRLQP